MGIMDNEGHDPLGFGNVRSAGPVQGDPNPYAALIEARAEIKRLRAALAPAKEKLAHYRAAHGGEYVGGVEYTALVKLIDDALNGKRTLSE